MADFVYVVKRDTMEESDRFIGVWRDNAKAQKFCDEKNIEAEKWYGTYYVIKEEVRCTG